MRGCKAKLLRHKVGGMPKKYFRNKKTGVIVRETNRRVYKNMKLWRGTCEAFVEMMKRRHKIAVNSAVEV